MDLQIGPIVRALSRHRARSLLALSMTVLTFAIVVNCLQLIRAKQAELDIDSGVDDDHLVYVEVDNFDPDLDETAEIRDRVRRDVEILRALPGVVAVENTNFKPWRGGGSSTTFTAHGSDQEPVRAQFYPAGPTLAQTLGVDIDGKGLTAREMDDDDAGTSVTNTAGLVMSRDLADALFPDGDALGKLVTTGPYVLRVDGIVDDLYNPYAWNIEKRIVFFPGYRASSSGTAYLMRVDDRRLGDLAAVERALLADDGRRALRLERISETRQEFDATNRLAVQAFWLVIALMVFVSAVSIMGLTSSAVAARRHEIGTRRALGASSRVVLRHFLVENAALTTVGLLVGVAAAYGLNVVLVADFGAPRLQLSWVLVAALVIALANILSALNPAWRASRIPPAIATKAR